MIENCYINFFLSGCVITAWKLFRQQLIVGKSMLLERATLNRIGGFGHFLDYLAEDFVMGMTYRACRFSINTNYVWVSNINTHTSVSGFFHRMSRWCKLRFHLKPFVYPLEILLNPFFPGLLALFLLGTGPGFFLFLMIFLLKTLLELFNYRYVNQNRRPRILHLPLIPFLFTLKDLLLLVAYFLPFFSDTVQWRGGRVTIGRDTRISPSRESLLLKGA